MPQIEIFCCGLFSPVSQHKQNCNKLPSSPQNNSKRFKYTVKQTAVIIHL